MPIDMGIATLGASALSALGNLGGGIMGAGGASAQNEMVRQQNQQMQQNYQQNRVDNAFYYEDNWRRQQHNADTVYRRGMADMKAAGLNPILAYQKGGNPAAGSVGMSGASGPNFQGPPANPGAELGRGVSRMVSSAADAARTVAEIDNTMSTNNLIQQQTAKTAAETKLTDVNTIKSAAETDLTKEDIKNRPFVQELLKGQTSAAGAAAGLSTATTKATEQDARRKEQFGDSAIGGALNTLQQILRRAGPAIRDGGGAAVSSPTARQAAEGGLSAANRGADRLWSGIKSYFGGQR